VILKNLIDTDKASQTKLDMNEGEKYYKAVHKISNRKIEYWLDGKYTEDKTKANNKAVNPFHQTLVDQKAEYIAGNPIAFSVTQDEANEASVKLAEEYQQLIQDYLGEDFNTISVDWIIGASNKAVEWLHIFIDEEGNFDYTITDAIQIIPIYDSDYEKVLIGLIRYYTVEFVTDNGEKKKRIKAEWWDENEVTFYEEQKDGNFTKEVVMKPDGSAEPNPRAHWLETNTATGASVGKGWGRVPFIPLYNNSKKLNDLHRIKALIDIYDLVISDFANNLEDIQDAIWVLNGYEGENLKEFMTNLKMYKAIKVNGEGSVDNKKIDIPTEARDKILDRLEDLIYMFGRGVNMNTDKFGNSPSGIALKFLFSNLDMKANALIRKMTSSLKELTWFVTEWINLIENKKLDPVLVSFTFNKSLIINEMELITSARDSKGIISDETIMEHHPWVDDPSEELIRLEEQGANIDFNEPDPNNPDNNKN
jgi:SPP1 family phage portal protein